MGCSEMLINCAIPKGLKVPGVTFNYKHPTPNGVKECAWIAR
jgi:hypothetical protein